MKFKVKVRSSSGYKRSNFEIVKPRKGYIFGSFFAHEFNSVICFHLPPLKVAKIAYEKPLLYIGMVLERNKTHLGVKNVTSALYTG